MLCTFTTKDGDLIVRSDDIRAIIDEPTGTRLVWDVCGTFTEHIILSTASENRDRIQREELDLIARVEAHRYETQRRLSEGYPVPPIKRGKA